MKKLAMIFLTFFIFACDEEDNMVIQEETLPYANKVWYLDEINGEKQERSEQNFESLTLNEGVGFNSYRIIERRTVTDSVYNIPQKNIVLDLGTWTNLNDEMLDLKSDINGAWFGDMGNNDRELYLISQSEDELIVDIKKYWLFQFDGTTEENGGIYKVRARYVSSKD